MLYLYEYLYISYIFYTGRKMMILARYSSYIYKVAASHEFISNRPIGRVEIYSKYPATIIKFVLNDHSGIISQPLVLVARMASEPFANLAKLSDCDFVIVCCIFFIK